MPKKYSVGRTLKRREKLYHLNIHLIGMKALKFKPFDFIHTKHSGIVLSLIKEWFILNSVV